MIRRCLVRFLLLAAVLGLVATLQGQQVGQALSPLLKSELTALDGSFRVDRLSVDREGADQVLRLDVGLARPLSLDGQTFYPDPRGRATASTLVGNLTLPCVLLIAVALAWPARSRRLLATRALVLVPALLLLCMLVTPFILWAEVWGLVVHTADPDPAFSALLFWGDFLLGGGGYALAIALGACVGSIGARPARP